MYSRPIFGMIKGDGADLIKKASNKNVLSEQTVESLQIALKEILNMSIIDLQKTGEDNRRFIENHDCFSLNSICDEIEDCLIKLN